MIRKLIKKIKKNRKVNKIKNIHINNANLILTPVFSDDDIIDFNDWLQKLIEQLEIKNKKLKFINENIVEESFDENYIKRSFIEYKNLLNDIEELKLNINFIKKQIKYMKKNKSQEENNESIT